LATSFVVGNCEAIQLLLSCLEEIFEMTSQSLQLAPMRRRWRPGSWLLFLTKAPNQAGVRAVILVAG
jgi:hypothetical protein